jgi:hypothetical protein
MLLWMILPRLKLCLDKGAQYAAEHIYQSVQFGLLQKHLLGYFLVMHMGLQITQV